MASDLSLHYLTMPSQGFTRHSETDRYLDFVQTQCPISLVNDIHVENNLKEIVNNRPKKSLSNDR